MFDEIYQQVSEGMWHWIESDTPYPGYEKINCEYQHDGVNYKMNFSLHVELIASRPEIVDMLLESKKRDIASAIARGEVNA